MIFQFFNLLDDMTVADNIALPAQLAGLLAAKTRARVDELLAALRIGPHRDAYPARFSGGERQRVAIARALVNRPALLLADEPTGALDTATGEEIGELLLDLNSSGQTLILVTHNPELAARYARRVIQLVDGQRPGRRSDADRGPLAQAARGDRARARPDRRAGAARDAGHGDRGARVAPAHGGRLRLLDHPDRAGLGAARRDGGAARPGSAGRGADALPLLQRRNQRRGERGHRGDTRRAAARHAARRAVVPDRQAAPPPARSRRGCRSSWRSA